MTRIKKFSGPGIKFLGNILIIIHYNSLNHPVHIHRLIIGHGQRCMKYYYQNTVTIGCDVILTRRLSHIPLAVLASVLASMGAIINRSAHFLNYRHKEQYVHIKNTILPAFVPLCVE